MGGFNRLFYIAIGLVFTSGCYKLPEAKTYGIDTLIIDRTNVFMKEDANEAEYHMKWHVNLNSGIIDLFDPLIGELYPMETCDVSSDLLSDIRELAAIGIKKSDNTIMIACIPEWTEQFQARAGSNVYYAPCGSIGFFNDPERARQIVDRIYEKVESQCYYGPAMAF